MTMLWLQFLMCSAAIVVCGVNLLRYGDVIAEKTGLGRAWIGLVLVASVTSLPELITGISSVTIAHAPDIAVVMTGISMVSLEHRLEKKAFQRLGWDAAALLTAFRLNIYLLSVLRG